MEGMGADKDVVAHLKLKGLLIILDKTHEKRNREEGLRSMCKEANENPHILGEDY